MATTPVLNLSTYAQFGDLVKRSMISAEESLPQVMRNAPFVNVEILPENTGLSKRYSERLSRSEYASYRAEGGDAAMALVQYGYEKDVTVYTVSKAISITEQMRKGGKDRDILDMVTDLSTLVPNRMELDLSHRITFFSSTSYTDMDGRTVDITVGDGFALGYASHTLTGSSTTYSTIITGHPQFSKGGLEVAEKSFAEGTFNNLGEKVMLPGTKTIVTTDDPNTCNSVRELMFATADITSSNANTFNVYNQKYTHLVNPRIATTATGGVDSTKAKYWALVANDASDFQLVILSEAQLSDPANGNNGEDVLSGNWTYVVSGTYGICIVTAKAWRLSTGVGA